MKDEKNAMEEFSNHCLLTFSAMLISQTLRLLVENNKITGEEAAEYFEHVNMFCEKTFIDMISTLGSFIQNDLKTTSKICVGILQTDNKRKTISEDIINLFKTSDNVH